jgi:hypothetical protein
MLAHQPNRHMLYLMNELHSRIEQPNTRQVNEVAHSLKTLLRDYGTVAYTLGVKQGRTVRNWVENDAHPANPLMQRRLETAEALAITVRDEQRPWVSGAWLISANPYLAEQSPAELIQSLTGEQEDKDVLERLDFAAKQFAASDIET